MISLKSKNEGFSSVYRVKTQNYNKIVKIYKQIAFTHFFREDLKKSKEFYNSINYLKITPFHKILSKHIIEIDEINSDKSLNKKEFFSNKNLLDQFKAQIGLMSEIKQNLINGNVLISAHGNSIRALCKKLFNLDNNQISNLEIPTGNPLVIELDKNSKIIQCEYLDKEWAKSLLIF